MIDSLHKYPLFPDLLENQKRSLEYFWEKGILEELELFSYLSRTNSQDFEEKNFSNSGEAHFWRRAHQTEKFGSKQKIQLFKNPVIKFSNLPDQFFGMISESFSTQSENSVFGTGSKIEWEDSRTKNANSSFRVDKFLLASQTQKLGSNNFRLNSLINKYGSHRKPSYSMNFVPLCLQKLTGKGHPLWRGAHQREKSNRFGLSSVSNLVTNSGMIDS